MTKLRLIYTTGRTFKTTSPKVALKHMEDYCTKNFLYPPRKLATEKSIDYLIRFHTWLGLGKLQVYREKRGLDPKRSKYIINCRANGIGKALKVKAAPPADLPKFQFNYRVGERRTWDQIAVDIREGQ